MAKTEKGTKPEKSKADKPSKSSDDFAAPSEAPATGEGWKLESDGNIGKLFLITPLREQDFTSSEYGDSKVIVCDVVELNESKPAKSDEHSDVFAFGGWVKGSLRGFINDRRVLARLAQDKSKGRGGKNSYAWVLEDADADDIEVAKEYLASVDPFKTKPGK